MLQDRILDYISFCEDFDQRIAQGEDHDFTEFDHFDPIADTASWRVPRPDGGVVPMTGILWFVSGQACWQHPETEPSTEQAANAVWASIAQCSQ